MITNSVAQNYSLGLLLRKTIAGAVASSVLRKT